MKKIKLSENVLEENDFAAKKARKYFTKQNIFVVNFMGSPGSGKTTLISGVIKLLKKKYSLGVIEGDVATSKDAEKIAKLKVPVVLLNTDQIGNACHLTSKMIRKAYKKLGKKVDILFIENIGNLVCPAEFDLGEHLRISMTSVTEGDDKISKYPPMFMNANAIVVNKFDLLKHFDFNLKEVKREIARLNPSAEVFYLSATAHGDLKKVAGYIEERSVQSDKITKYK
ncbi:MAG: hydrogenase nickel incorporation protein HypB [Candidatus Firestonebacteria bacterium]